MTPEAIKKALVEACPTIIKQSDLGIWMWRDGKMWDLCLHNDPLQDLNAIQRVARERFKDWEDGDRLYTELCRLADKTSRWVWQLTAADWCEALLRTTGGWRE